jgi:uncharacterized Fe-S cluster-containing radical SAM superfamily enzyme
VKSTTIIVPLLLPKLSDQSAAQLLDILAQFIACARHHYDPQIQRWRQRQRHRQPPLSRPAATSPSDSPF